MTEPTPADSPEAELTGNGGGLKPLLKGLVLIASLAAIGFLVTVTGLREALDTAWVESAVAGQGGLGILLYLAVGTLAAAVGLPRQAVAFLGGYAFGVVMGTVWGVLASALGCALAFHYARFLGRDMVKQRFARRIARVDGLLAGHPFTMTLLIRFLPVGSNLLTNLAAGVSSVRAVPFVLGSLVGYLPQTIVFALAGKAVKLDPDFHLDPLVSLLLAAGLLVVSGGLGVSLYRRVRRTRGAAEKGHDFPT